MRPLLIFLAGCATFSSEYGLEPKSQARIAVWVEAPVYDRWRSAVTIRLAARR